MVFLVCWYYLILPFGAFCKFSITILPNSLVCLFSMNLTWLVNLFCLTYEIKFLCNFSSAFLNLKKLITFDDLPSEIRMSYNMCDLTNFGFPLIELSLTLYLFKTKICFTSKHEFSFIYSKRQSELLPLWREFSYSCLMR